MGMPKMGTTTLNKFFNCAGINSFHWTCRTVVQNSTTVVVKNTKKGNENNSIPIRCGDCMKKAIQKGLPPLATCGYGYNHGEGSLGLDPKTKQPVLAAKAFTQNRF